MCDLEEFLRRAKENREFAECHCESNDDVWAVIVYGYSAILLINAIIIKYKWEPENHRERWKMLNDLAKGLPQLRNIRAPYNFIYPRCRDGRYRPNCSFSPEEIEEIKSGVEGIEKVVKRLIDTRV